MGNGGSYIPVMALPAAWFVTRKKGLATGIATVGTGTGLSLAGIKLPYFIVSFKKKFNMSNGFYLTLPIRHGNNMLAGSEA